MLFSASSCTRCAASVGSDVIRATCSSMRERMTSPVGADCISRLSSRLIVLARLAQASESRRATSDSIVAAARRAHWDTTAE